MEDDWVAPAFHKDAGEKAKLSEYLTKTALLAYLDPKSKDTMIDAFQKRTFTNGDNIITQGDDGDFYYILDSGSADAMISKPQGSPEIKVYEYSSGGAFGELALIHGEPRAATVRATSDCVTYALDRDTFRKIMMKQGKSDMQQRVSLLGFCSICLCSYVLHFVCLTCMFVASLPSAAKQNMSAKLTNISLAISSRRQGSNSGGAGAVRAF